MSSNLRVNNILPSVGTNVAIGTAGGSVTLTGTTSGTFSGNLTGTVNSSGIATFSSGIVVSSGSTAAPSISPSGDSNTGIFFPSPDTVAIGEGGAEALRVNSSGGVQIANGNLIFSTAGTGIDFSATANSSGTMTSELLSDYEEGTFTPTINGWSGTYSRQMGRYVKIGKMVYIQGEVITNSGGSHTASFPGPANIPFVMENNGASYYGVWTAVGTFGSPGASSTGAGPLDNASATAFFPNKYTVNGGTGNLSAAEFGTSGGGMRFFAVYREA